mgnify:CR=1 FL=1
MVGIEGVFAVYDDSTGPEPVGALPGGPTTVKSGQIHGATDAWERGYNGTGVRVAIADSGISLATSLLMAGRPRKRSLPMPG